MNGKKSETRKLSTTSTKQEMLEAYNAVLQELKEKEEAELKPEKKVEEKKAKEVLKVADALSPDGITREIGELRVELGKMLTHVSDSLSGEVEKLKKTREAVELKEKELQELFGVEKEAMTLAALIESQNRRRQEFDTKMASDKENLAEEIETTKAEWQDDRKAREAEAKELDAAEKKRRDRAREEFEYAFGREQKQLREALAEEKARVEKELETKKTDLESDLSRREAAIGEKEQELADLRKRVGSFGKELEETVTKAVQEVTGRLTLEAKNREELMKKEFEGERNVLKARIEAFDKTVKEQSDQIAKVSQQLERSYQKVEELAVKALETSSTAQSVASLQQMMTEQGRRQPQEK